MKESAQAALTLVKARPQQFGLEPDVLEKSDIHVHVPAGATPKDGPSAGVAMFLALVSLLHGRPVRTDVAMTGEISLRGLVLPIGGLKEKLLAALRAGIKTVMVPARNEKDLEDIPADARERAGVRLDSECRRGGRWPRCCRERSPAPARPRASRRDHQPHCSPWFCSSSHFCNGAK